LSTRTDQLRLNRIILITLAALLILGLAYQARDGLVPFIFALVLGYLLVPLIDLLNRRLPRVAAILLVYVLFFGALIGLGFLIIPGAAAQVRQLIDSYPAYSERFMAVTRDVQAWYAALNLPDGVRTQIENGLRNAGGGLLTAVETALFGTLRVVTQAVSFIFGLVVIPFWLFYVMKDKDAAVSKFYNLIPRAVRTDVRRILRIASDVLNDYIRGQLLLGLVVGTATTIGLFIVGAPYWLLLGVLNGFTELIPILGPILGAIPGIIIAALTGDWGLLLKVIVVYVLVQLLENNLLVPKIQGDSVKLHPAIIILALVVGGEIAGLVGVIAAVPVTAIARDIYLYLYKRLGEGYSPRQAESQLPSRQDDEAADAARARQQAAKAKTSAEC
jgi:predicted PurR-regulated permease PerM